MEKRGYNMQKTKLRWTVRALIVVLMAAAVCLCVMPSVVANAGVSNRVVCDSEDFSNELNLGDWYISDKDIRGTQEGIVFDNAVGGGEFLSSKTKLSNPNADLTAQCFAADLTFRFKEAINGRVAVTWGLRLPYSDLDSANTSMLYFTTKKEGGVLGLGGKNKLYIGISSYDASGNEKIVLAETALNSETGNDNAVCVSMKVTQGGGLTVIADETTAYDSQDAKCATAGYFGIGITSKNNDFTVKKLTLKGFSDFSPENTNLLATFNQNQFNTAEIRTVVAVAGQGSILPRNKRLEFTDLTEGFVATRYRYSNSEISFDVPYIQRTPVYDAQGNLVKGISAGFSVGLGHVTSDNLTDEAAITFKFVPEGGSKEVVPSRTKVQVYLGKTLLDTVQLALTYNIWDNSVVKDRTVGVLITVRDCTVSLGLRYADEVGFTKIYSHEFESNPDGYIRITGNGTPASQAANLPEKSVEKCNFAVDNLSIVNNDADGQLKYADYVVSYESVKDYDYVYPWDDNDMLFYN